MNEANGISQPARANAEALSVTFKDRCCYGAVFQVWSRLGAVWQHLITLSIDVVLGPGSSQGQIFYFAMGYRGLEPGGYCGALC